MFLTLLVASRSHKILKKIYYNNEKEPRGEGATAFEKRETDSQNFQGQKTNKETNKIQPIKEQTKPQSVPEVKLLSQVNISNSQKTLVY